MSKYGVYDAEIDYMVCGGCKAEAFTWMAEVFACPTCGDMNYKFPIFVDTVTTNNNHTEKELHEEEGIRLWENVSASTSKTGRKRKRKVVSSDEETR
jgi:hypothetical protein